MNADSLSIPTRDGQKRFRSLARFSWMSLIWSIVANILITTATTVVHPSAQHTASAVCAGVFSAAGVLSGLVALGGIKRYGRRGILWPALTGICLWLLLTWAAVQTIARFKLMSGDRGTRLAPAVHAAGARRVHGSEPDFSFDLPAGYQDVTSATLPTKYQLGFLQRLPNEPVRMILVSRMSGKIFPKRLQNSDLPPGSANATLTPFHWRGLEIDGFRVLETNGDIRYVTLNAQIPLRNGSVQLGVSGSQEVEPLLRGMMEHILSTFDGETNW